MRRANGGRYVPPGSTNREPMTRSALPGVHRREQRAELRCVVLAVAVEPNRDVVPLVARIAEARLDGAADADVERKPEHGCAVRFGHAGGLVAGRVVHHDDRGRRGRRHESRRRRARSHPPRSMPGRRRRAVRSRKDPGLEPDQLEQRTCAVRVRVLVEHALARATPHLLRLRRIGDELAIRGHGLVRTLDDEELAPGLEPAVDAFMRVRHDRSTRRRELERARRRRAGDRRVRPSRHVEVHPGRRDRSREER